MLRNTKNTKEGMQLPRIIQTESFDETESCSDLNDIKNFPLRLRTNSESSQDSQVAASPRNRRRSKRFEDALLKWQEYGNDIIERKPPNFLRLNNKPRKGAWIYAGGKYKERPEFEEAKEAEEIGEIYQKQVQELAGRLGENMREFQDMHERSAKIELTLKQLKEKALKNLDIEENLD